MIHNIARESRLLSCITVNTITLPDLFRQEFPLMLMLGLLLPYVCASYVVQFCLILKTYIVMFHPSAAAVPYPA